MRKKEETKNLLTDAVDERTLKCSTDGRRGIRCDALPPAKMHPTAAAMKTTTRRKGTTTGREFNDPDTAVD